MINPGIFVGAIVAASMARQRGGTSGGPPSAGDWIVLALLGLFFSWLGAMCGSDPRLAPTSVGGLVTLFVIFFGLAAAVAREQDSRTQAESRRAGLVWLVVAPVTSFCLAAALTGGRALWVNGPLGLAGLVLLFPWWVATRVAVPLGMVRSACVLGSLSYGVWRRDARGGGAVAGALALLRGWRPGRSAQLEPDELEAMAWIERRLGGTRRLGAGGVLGMGLLQAARGDLRAARIVLAALEDGDPEATPWLALHLTGEWLAVDAAARGDWRRVLELGRRGKWHERSAVTSFLGAVAARLLGEAPPSDARLWALFALSRRWRALWPLLQRALATPATTSATSSSTGEIEADAEESFEEPAPRGDRMADALALHARLIAEPARIPPGLLAALGKRWDAALGDPQLRAWLLERATALGCVHAQRSSEQLLAGLVRDVESDLAAAARRTGARLTPDEGNGPLVERAALRLRGELLGELETASEALRRRTDDRAELRSALADWSDYAALRAAYQEAHRIGGEELRRLAFPPVHREVCHLAVDLFNVQRQRFIANAMFRWLLAEARAVGDARATTLEEGNVAAGA